MAPIKVLLVDDSPSTRMMLSLVINNTPDMHVVGQAVNGLQAIQMVQELCPDVVLMDVMMPQMDGLEATRVIMRVQPTPIVITSASLESSENNIAFEAINAGALSVMGKPGVTRTLSYEDSINEFIRNLRAMSAVHVIRHRSSGAATPIAATGARTAAPPPTTPMFKAVPELVAIASSTGGPQTLGEILKELTPSFKAPIAIVQHISPDFVGPMVDWFRSILRIPVQVAQPGERPAAGTVYFAPAKSHLQLTSDHRFALTDVPANVPHIPSGDVLLKSVAQHYGIRANGIVLTGMGDDGARGLRAMYDTGALTIAQDEASCVVFGMPREAIALGGARQVLPPSGIAKLLLQYTQ